VFVVVVVVVVYFVTDSVWKLLDTLSHSALQQCELVNFVTRFGWFVFYSVET
jgi:hypothetical protein